MKLKALLKGLDVVVKGPKEVTITGISADSRTVAPGNLFIAKRGSAFDGTQFIAQAVNAGAVAIVTDIYDPFLDTTQIIHSDTASLEAKLAARYYGQPSDDLFTIGVTGTKGKTTTTYLIKHLLDGLGSPCGLIGTVETVVGETRFFSKLTTQDAISNQKLLREMVLKGCKAAALEVSSHGLEQGRVDEIEFDLALFTNLYPDHLDYHKTIDAYAAAKAKLFNKADRSIVNADSYWGSYKGLSFGIEKGDLRATDLVFHANGTEFSLDGCRFHSPLIGRFNVYNALGAIAVAMTMGNKLEKIASFLSTFPGTPARLQRIGNVFIDFAHAGEALENVLQTLKEISKGRVIVVFGCGGNRDPQRRAGMGAAAEKWADLSIITSDNPRLEDPHEIARQIVSAFKKAPLVELDRKKAIQMAISMAEPNDLVLIAGKGHERVQIFGTQTFPFDDLAVAKEALQNRPVSAMVDAS
jgi:UDP-N-acetylmuramoyl-L-alanyl-D-glutamate--2,6-diaminopimelate ligase